MSDVRAGSNEVGTGAIREHVDAGPDGTDPRTKVILWGPLPHRNGVFGGGIGGYARCNSQMLKSFLARRFEVLPVPMTVPRYMGRVGQALDLVPRFARDVLRIGAALFRERPDVLHITALYYRSIYREAFAVWLAHRLGVAVYYDIRAGKFEHFYQNAPGVERALLRYIVRNADDIGVEGRRYLDFVSATFGRQAVWVPNFFLDDDLLRFDAAPLDRPEDGEPLRVGFVGYLIPEKGIDVLLEASYRLSRERPVEVTLIGERSARIEQALDRAEARQDGRFTVRTPGRLELDAVLAELRNQHMFAFLSRFHGEGHSNAVTEAMAIGLPVLSSDNGFLADVVTPECGVVLRKESSPEEVCSAMRTMQADWPALQAMGRNARTRVRTAFNEGTALAATAAVYRRHAPDDDRRTGPRVR